MAKMRKKTKKRNSQDRKEAKGLFLFALTIILILSLCSFYYKQSSLNYLGLFGYYLALTMSYLFGFGSYLFSIFLVWLGWRYIRPSKEPSSIGFKTFSFFSFLFCFCILLNVLAHHHPEVILGLEPRIFKETLLFSKPYPHALVRLNFGGVPLYYLYADLPYFNLQKLLSSVGVVLIFSITGVVSFLLFTGIEILSNLKIGITKLASLLKRLTLIILKAIKYLAKLLASGFILLHKFLLNTKDSYSKKRAVKYIERIQKENIPLKRVDEVILENKTLFKEKKKPKKRPTFLKKEKKKNYNLPTSELLSNPPSINHPLLKKELKKQAQILQDTLLSFGIEAKVGNIHCGPTITSFEVHPSIGVKVQKIKTLANDIALNLEAKSIRIIAPIPGKAAVGVEIPSLYPQTVSLKEMHLHYRQMKKKLNIPLLLGKTVGGEYVVTDLTKMPHCLIAGATGAGKSVCINTIVMSILMNSEPDEIKLMMIDPKKVELTQYSNLPHMIAPVITEPHGAYAALQWLVKEMQKRYDILKQLGLRNITAFNNRKIKKKIEEALDLDIPKKMPFIVGIIDEFADLMIVSSTDLETPIARIAQMARAVGIHLILATQRPSREVITGIIKANFPSRIAFKVASRVNSQIILDDTGAESLLGNGDLLFLPPGSSHIIRAQGAYIADEDISRITTAICHKSPANYLIPSFDQLNKLDHNLQPRDKLYEHAVNIVLETKNASTTFLQRKLKIGYARAASLMDELEENGIIGPPEGGKPRRILATKDDLE